MATKAPTAPPVEAFIGYYNHNNYPVQFSLASSRSAPIMLEAGEPIVQEDGTLVPYPQAELDEEVKNQIIARIRKDDVRFATLNQRAVQAASITRVQRDPDGFPVENVGTEHIPPAHRHVIRTPDVTVSAGGGIQSTSESIKKAQAARESVTTGELGNVVDGNLDEWIERAKAAGKLTEDNGTLIFDGQPFKTKKALGKFVEMSTR